MRNTDTYHLLVVSPGSCNMCGTSCATSQSVTIESIEQQDGVGWTLSGAGRVHAQCPRCGAMYDAVRKAIPIECSSYDCPGCGGIHSLRYNVKKIEASGNDFTFQADITCSKCNKRKSFVETLKGLLKVKKLEVKLTGISIER